MKKKTNLVFFIITGFLTTILSYGLSELYNESVYFFGYELIVMFSILLVIFYTKEELANIEFSNIELRVQHLNRVFYKYFSFYFIFNVLLTLLVIVTNPNSFSHGYLPFLLPVISVILMVDITISMYLREASQRINHSESFKLNPSMIDLLLVPFIIASIIAILGEFLNIHIAVLLMFIATLVIGFKLLVIKKFKSSN